MSNVHDLFRIAFGTFSIVSSFDHFKFPTFQNVQNFKALAFGTFLIVSKVLEHFETIVKFQTFQIVLHFF